MKDLVSVIIPTYNRAYCIKNAIDSVLQQEYEQMEIIIVDDASTDNTREVIQNIKDRRIKYICNDKNCGAAASRNIGVKMASGKYIAFQDSDDIWLKEKLQKQLEIIEASDYGMVYCSFERIFPDGRIEKVPRQGIQKEARQGEIYPYLLAESYISTQTMLLKREVFQQIEGFDETMKSYEDYDLAIRISKGYKIGYVDEVLVQLNTLSDSVDMNMINGIISSAYLIRKYETDLKKYGLYQRKCDVLLQVAETYGFLEPIKKFIGQSL